MKISRWEDMTVADQLKIKEIGELQMPSDDEKNMMVAAHLAGIRFADMLMMPLESVREYMDNTEFLLHPPVPAKARNKYVINGRTYTLFKDPSEMTVAQFIDFQQIYREGFENMPAEMLCIFLIPRGHQYNDGYDKQEQLEDMLHMNLCDALGVCNFFTRRCLKSIRRMRTFSRMMLRWQRLIAPKDRKEMVEAMAIQTDLILEGLEVLFGLEPSTRSATSRNTTGGRSSR